jgi:hypothetical protein
MATGDHAAPSRRKKCTVSQPNSRTAASTIASNTGCASAGDWLMMRRISDVAACRACAAFSSLASLAASNFGLTEWELRFADLAMRLPTARRSPAAFRLPCFFFGELPFAESRPMGVSHTAPGNSNGFGKQPVGAAEQNREAAERSVASLGISFLQPQIADSSTFFCPIRRNQRFECA